jgi:hypothetical protein
VDPEVLADELIATGHGPDSIAQVYRFLSRHHGDGVARAEFLRFLRGDRSELLLQTAREVLRRTREENHAT